MAISSFLRNTLCMAAVCVLCMTGCHPTEAECAAALVTDARQRVDSGQWHQARILLDSVHHAYPKQVAVRRQAKALSDSITYLEAQRTLSYNDSLLQGLLPQADALLRSFRYEKNDRYESVGKYVYRLLATSGNTSRNFLQAYICDDRTTVVKSYYFGGTSAQQQAVRLIADGEEACFRGTNHRFQSEGWHEIMTLNSESSLELLNFVSTHLHHRIRVRGEGDGKPKTWVYYLSDTEKSALAQTYQLGILMHDIQQAEQHIHTANAQIRHYEQRVAD